MSDYTEVLEQHRRNAMALTYRAATIEANEPWDETAQGIYENIQTGMMECDETGRKLRLTELGKAQVESTIDKQRQ